MECDKKVWFELNSYVAFKNGKHFLLGPHDSLLARDPLFWLHRTQKN
jgi:hypothetical protein